MSASPEREFALEAVIANPIALSTTQLLETLGISEENHPETIKSFNEFEQLVSRTFDEEITARIIEVIQIMIQAHIEQRRADGLYINHPIDVARKTIELCAVPDVDMVIAAVLHDVVEDQSENFLELCGVEVEEGESLSEKALQVIREKYSENVANYISALSNPDFNIVIAGEGTGLSLQEHRQRKRELYAEHVAHSIQNPVVCLIKYADFSFNALNLPDFPDGKQKTKWALKYRPAVDVFIERISNLSHPLNTTQQLTMVAELQSAADYIDVYLQAQS